MRFHVVAILLAVSLAGCTFTLPDYCEGIYTCYGYDDAQQCVDTFFDDSDPARACLDQDAYLQCGQDCLVNDCGAALDECELACWNAHCGEALR